MQVRIYTGNNNEENYVLKSFADGCPEDVWFGSLDDYKPSDLAVVFGTYKKQVPISFRRGHVVHEQKKHGLDTVIVETGYVNRGAGPSHHYAVGLNGLNGRADFRNEDSPPDRALEFAHKLKPWRTDGEHILVCGQVPWDASVDHIDFVEWTHSTVSSLKAMTKRPIVYRPHPLARTYAPWGSELSRNYWLEDDLNGCWCVVTFNSNSGVEAILAGIPTVAMDEGSMIMPVASSLGQVEAPWTPSREQWFNDLCYAQWTPTEMQKGFTWNHLFKST